MNVGEKRNLACRRKPVDLAVFCQNRCAIYITMDEIYSFDICYGEKDIYAMETNALFSHTVEEFENE